MQSNSTNAKSKSNLLIYQKYLELIYYTNDILRKYPKVEKFALVKEIKNTLYSGLRFLMYAIKVYNKQEKLKYLNEFDICLHLLKMYIRLSYKYKYITIQNSSTWNNLITDINHMLDNWMS